MDEYELTWINDHLAVGHAPFSYADLDVIKAQGIGVIVNLCAEYCDLHEIEEGHGFAVHYLPVVDECAPDMAAMETALDWLDGQIAAGHKALVHCRFGVGRTGTFVSAFLMRGGMELKAAEKILKKARCGPTHYCQWKLLKRYKKKIKNPVSG